MSHIHIFDSFFDTNPTGRIINRTTKVRLLSMIVVSTLLRAHFSS